jgi:hypothetical protein
MGYIGERNTRKLATIHETHVFTLNIKHNTKECHGICTTSCIILEVVKIFYISKIFDRH